MTLKKLSSIEDRGQADRVTTTTVHALPLLSVAPRRTPCRASAPWWRDNKSLLLRPSVNTDKTPQ